MNTIIRISVFSCQLPRFYPPISFTVAVSGTGIDDGGQTVVDLGDSGLAQAQLVSFAGLEGTSEVTYIPSDITLPSNIADGTFQGAQIIPISSMENDVHAALQMDGGLSQSLVQQIVEHMGAHNDQNMGQNVIFTFDPTSGQAVVQNLGELLTL